jgi:hypothetical protein
MENNIRIDNNMNKTFETQNIRNNLFSKEILPNSQILNNNDIKAQTLSMFGINKDNLLNLNDNSINNTLLFKQPQFELENIYRERLLSLYKNKSKEELLNYFIESETNNILLRKEIEKNKLDKVKLENKIIDIQQENIMLKNKIKNLLNYNNNNNIVNQNQISKQKDMDNDNNDNNEHNLSLPNKSFVQNELNIQTDYNNMDIDALLINNNKY